MTSRGRRCRRWASREPGVPGWAGGRKAALWALAYVAENELSLPGWRALTRQVKLGLWALARLEAEGDEALAELGEEWDIDLLGEDG
ncbi:MAG: hypothetical protein ACOC8X_04725 [Chloroflexota bacterium]